MTTSLFLIAASGSGALTEAAVAALAYGTGGCTSWLAPGEACVLTGIDAPPDEARKRAIDVVGDTPLDIIAMAGPPRRMRLLISDMDSTMITTECIDDLAVFAGVGEEVAGITRRAMNGDIDYVASLHERVALLAGLPVTVIDEVLRQRMRLMPGARELVSTMGAWGAVTALVSGGFTQFTSRVARELGFGHDMANRLGEKDGYLTGKVVPPVRDSTSKLHELRRLLDEHDIDAADALAVGDGANDLLMLDAAGMGVAFRAHPAVAQVSRIAVRHGDLTALLYLQGVPRSAFASATGDHPPIRS